MGRNKGKKQGKDANDSDFTTEDLETASVDGPSDVDSDGEVDDEKETRPAINLKKRKAAAAFKMVTPTKKARKKVSGTTLHRDLLFRVCFHPFIVDFLTNLSV